MEKKFKITSYFVEPAQYTLDLIENIYSKFNFSYRFLYNQSRASKTKIQSIRKLSFLRQLQILLKDYKYSDLIIFNGFYKRELWFFFILNIFSKNKVFLALESDSVLKLPSFFIKKIVKKYVLKILFSSRYIYGFPGGFGSHVQLFTHYGMPIDRIITIPMVIDNTKFVKKCDTELFTFIYVGRFIKLKNIELVIQSFLKLKFKNIHLKLIGDGALFSDLQKKYSNNNIKFLGSVFGEDLIHEYKNSNVLVLASKSEQWGLVINEAMSSGLPVITSKHVGANFDLVKDKNTGFIFDPDKEGDLQEKMLILYQNKEQYELFSENAYNLIHNYWNYSLYSKQLNVAIQRMNYA